MEKLSPNGVFCDNESQASSSLMSHSGSSNSLCSQADSDLGDFTTTSPKLKPKRRRSVSWRSELVEVLEIPAEGKGISLNKFKQEISMALANKKRLQELEQMKQDFSQSLPKVSNSIRVSSNSQKPLKKVRSFDGDLVTFNFKPMTSTLMEEAEETKQQSSPTDSSSPRSPSPPKMRKVKSFEDINATTFTFKPMASMYILEASNKFPETPSPQEPTLEQEKHSPATSTPLQIVVTSRSSSSSSAQIPEAAPRSRRSVNNSSASSTLLMQRNFSSRIPMFLRTYSTY